MGNILSVGNSSNDYSINTCSTKAEKNNKKEEETKSKEKQIITIHEGKFYAKYLVDDDGSKILLFKKPVEEDNKNKFEDLKSFNDKQKIEHFKIAVEYKENIRNACNNIKDENDNIKDLLRMIS